MGKMLVREGNDRGRAGRGTLRPIAAACLLMALFTAVQLSAAERPRPSRHLRHAFQMFLLLEEKVERLEWDAAAGVGRAVRAEILSLASELKAAAGEGTVDGFLYDFGRLLKQVESRNLEGSLATYVEAEKSLFDIIESFDCKVHPVIPILDTEIHEALQSVRQKKLAIAAEEVAEVTVYFRTARDILGKRGLPEAEIAALEDGIARAAECLTDGDARAAEEALADVAARTAGLITR